MTYSNKTMKLVFVCSPYRGDEKENTSNATKYCRLVAGCGYIPIAPYLFFPQFLNDSDEIQRLKGIHMGLELLKLCSQMWVFANEVTEGMELEIQKAKELDIPIQFMDKDMEGMVMTQKRIGSKLKSIIKDLNKNGR